MKHKEDTLLKRIKQNVPMYVMMSPFFIIFFLLTVIPVLSSVVLSLTDFNMVQFPKWIGLDNYIRLFLEDEVFIIALKNTLIFALITGPIGYLLSFVVAWFINDLRPVAKNIITLFMYAPALCGGMITIWTYIFASDAKGLLNSLLIKFGFITQPISFFTDTRYNFTVCIFIIIWSSMGVGFLSLLSGLKSLDKSYFEAAAIDGIRNRWQELYYVTLPQIGPQLVFSAVMTISSSFSIGSAIAGLTGFPSTEYSTHTLVLHMTDYATIRFEMGYSATVAVVLFALMWTVWFGIQKLLKKFIAD
ncbi:MAG: sugar ABC transporter permease [Clostridia bacterium]|nr:sugar ABC transporter permease [Clostridia bacterium]